MKNSLLWMPGAGVAMVFMGLVAGMFVMSYPLGQVPRGFGELALLGLFGGLLILAVWVGVMASIEKMRERS